MTTRSQSRPEVAPLWHRRRHSLAFILALAAAQGGSAVRADITFFDVFKVTTYNQTSISAPASVNGYFGALNVSTNNAADLTGATVAATSPSSPFTLTGSGLNYSYGTPGFTSKTAFDLTLPNGTAYKFSLTGGNFNGQSATINTPANDAYASTVPYFTNSTFTTLQGFNANQAITLTFNPFTAAAGVNAPLTFIGINRVSDGASVFGTSGDNTLSSANIAANTLQAATKYDLSIVYSDRISTPNAGFGNATGFVGYDVRTDLIFTTAAAVPEPSILTLAGVGCLLALGVRAFRAHGRVSKTPPTPSF